MYTTFWLTNVKRWMSESNWRCFGSGCCTSRSNGITGPLHSRDVQALKGTNYIPNSSMWLHNPSNYTWVFSQQGSDTSWCGILYNNKDDGAQVWLWNYKKARYTIINYMGVQWLLRVPSNLKLEYHPLVGNKIIVHLDIVGASPVGVAPTTSSFST